MPKLIFSGNLLNTIKNNILKPLEPFPLFKMASKMAAKMLTPLYGQVDISPDTQKIMTKGFSTVFCPTAHIVNNRKKIY